MKRSIIFTLLLAWPLLCAAEPAQLVKNDTLRDKPFSDAKTLMTLKIGQTVEILKREGAWYQLQVDGKNGWLPMLSVRRTAAAATVSAGSLAQTVSGRATTGKIVATTGVRGLGEEQLSAATFSEAAIAAAEQYRIAPLEAAAFAKDGNLQPRDVPPFVAADQGGKP